MPQDLGDPFSIGKEALQECIEALGVPGNIRGEALSLEQFARLSDLIYEKQNPID